MNSAGAARILVLGVGNSERGDDAAGRIVARTLRGTLSSPVEVVETDGETACVVEMLEDTAAAYFVDACTSGSPIGTVHRFDVSRASLPRGVFGVSTHGLGLHEAIELARALGQLPSSCIVYAIEGESFETGAPLSPRVAEAVDEVVACLRAELGDGGPGRERASA